MANMMKSALGTITTPLAQELYDNILNDVEDADILALRAVSRDARKKSNEGFLTRFFTSRRLPVLKTSLQRFINICNYPELDLITKLKSITFVNADIWDERDRFKMLDANYITIVLKKLKDANVFPALQISQEGYMDGHTATEKVFEAIVQAEFPVKDLSLCDWDKTCSAFKSLATLKDRLYANISDLRRLSVNGCVYEERGGGLFSDVLAAVPLLEHFALDACDDYSYQGMFAAFPRDQLKSLEIRNGRFERSDLDSFLDSQRGRLTCLELSNVALESVVRNGGWAPLLEKLAEQFNLDNVRLDLVAGGCFNVRANGQGRAAVQSSLRNRITVFQQKASLDSASDVEMDDSDDYDEDWSDYATARSDDDLPYDTDNFGILPDGRRMADIFPSSYVGSLSSYHYGNL